MRILVTGGAGYIGSHAVKSLVNAGHEVIVLDNLSQGHRWALDSRALFIEGDVGNEEKLVTIFKQEKVEAVMHFAAYIEVGESVTNPHKYYENNFARTLALLAAMRECKVNRLIFSSTAAVYGNPLHTPIEETHPLFPINPYGRAKMMVETALEDFKEAYGLGYATLRYFNVAGANPDGAIGEAHEPETHLIPRILQAAVGKSSHISVYGTDYETKDGTCIRDYIHVEDLVQAHLLALDSIKPGSGRIYNLGSENGFSVLEVIEACRRVTGKPIPLKEEVRRPGDPAILVASSSKIRRELNWVRRYPDLETIVAHAWAWQRRLSCA